MIKGPNDCTFSNCENPRRPKRRLCTGHTSQKAKGQKLGPLRDQVFSEELKRNSDGFGVEPIPGHDGYFARSDGEILGKSGRILEGWVDEDGYVRHTFYIDQKFVNITAHRAVALAFHGLPPEGSECVAHLNGNPSDNRPENLVWATLMVNASHKKLHGTNLPGEKNPSSKLTVEDVIKIRQLRDSGFKLQTLSRMFNVTESTVSSICLRRTWSHV